MLQVDGQVNKSVDNPPAYSDYSSPFPSGETSRNGYSTVGAPKGRHVQEPSFDQVHILDRKNEIRGTFYIDPAIPSLDPSRIRKGCKAKKLKLIQPIHASFFTRHKSILLNLGTAGNVVNTPKANVVVSNRSNDININLLPMHTSQPRIGLEASSRKGNVVVYLPDDFQGVIHMEAMRGTVKVLPMLQRRVKIANQSNRDVILMVGTGGEANHCQETSFCHLKTNKGNVILGLTSADDPYVPKGSIWQWIVGRIGALTS